MKRIYIYALLLIAALIPVSMVSGQEKKNEQKIKIVIDDGSGAKTIIDTVYTGDKTIKTIKTGDGKIIIIDGEDEGISTISTGEGDQKVFVTVTDDSDGKKSVDKTVTIISGDKTSSGSEKGNVYVFSRAGGSPDKKVIVSSSASGSASWSAKESDEEMTKYVIAKDGMIITVEGNDEAKAQEIVKMVQDKLGVKK